jgi:hypothetical protein
MSRYNFIKSNILNKDVRQLLELAGEQPVGVFMTDVSTLTYVLNRLEQLSNTRVEDRDTVTYRRYINANRRYLHISKLPTNQINALLTLANQPIDTKHTTSEVLNIRALTNVINLFTNRTHKKMEENFEGYSQLINSINAVKPLVEDLQAKHKELHRPQILLKQTLLRSMSWKKV